MLDLHAIRRDCELWLPRLIQLWREQSPGHWTHGPADRLLPAEAKSIAAGIRRLSLGLTRNRPLAGEQYFNDPVCFGAYLLYFWPVSYIQARLALSTLASLPKSILDLGGGAGPLAAAGYDLGVRTVMLVDRNRKALAAARRLFTNLECQLTTLVWDPMHDHSLPAQVWNQDLIAMQHTLNELWPHTPQKHEQRLRFLKEGLAQTTGQSRLLMIEPALKSTAQDVLLLRDRLCQSGCHVEFPCLHNQPCPTLQADDSCHAEADWEPPDLVHNLIQRAGLHKRLLKMIIMLFGPITPSPLPDQGHTFLVLSAPRRHPTRQHCATVCGAMGRCSLLWNPPDSGERFRIQPGDILEVADVQRTAQGWWVARSTPTRIQPQAPSLKIIG